MCRPDTIRIPDSNKELIQTQIYCWKQSNSTDIHDFSTSLIILMRCVCYTLICKINPFWEHALSLISVICKVGFIIDQYNKHCLKLWVELNIKFNKNLLGSSADGKIQSPHNALI